MQRMRDLRKQHGLTMLQLSNYLGVSESAVSQYETGKRSPDLALVSKISKIFNVTVDYLLGDFSSPTPTNHSESLSLFLGQAMAGAAPAPALVFMSVMSRLTLSQWEVLAQVSAMFSEEMAKKEGHTPSDAAPAP